jgi:glyoxylase-like metal-dependent hydrolase (beta-lactamase superfamily II)
LENKLNDENLTFSDIDMVFLTHYHFDHAFLASQFSNAKILDGSTIYDKDLEIDNSDKIPSTDIEILLTPGHAKEHSSLLVKEENKLTIVAGDVFGWTREEEQKVDNLNELISREDPYALDMEELKASRRKLLEIADIIVPGHGKVFSNLHKKK